MLFSYNWLKKYVPQLPEPEKLEEGIIFRAFEVENLVKVGADWILDIKILPDRAHDCLCHLGMAREISTIFGLELKKAGLKKPEIKDFPSLKIQIDDPKACRRYIGRSVRGVTVGESPSWLQQDLKAIGQRPINNVVDIANYIMFDLGQPLHAFDADKIDGSVRVRLAQPGEKIVTLDGDEVELDESILVIADEVAPLAIAGLKGGQKAEVTKETKNLFLEAANFDPTLIRKTSAKIKLKTDASKRFENELSRETALEAMTALSSGLQELAGGDYGELSDLYPLVQPVKTINIEPDFINRRLGIEVPESEMKGIFLRLGLGVREGKDFWAITVPSWRLDLTEGVNLVEEVGRIYGYDKIKAEILPPLPATAYKVEHDEKQFLVANLIRKSLLDLGFSEVYGYAFAEQGAVRVKNPLASDKAFLRVNLIDWLAGKIKENTINTIFDDESVKVFELGTVFPQKGWEEVRLALGLGYRKKIKGVDLQKELTQAVAAVAETIGWSGDLPQVGSFISPDNLCQIFEFNFEKMVDMAGPVEAMSERELLNPEASYRPLSPYPRIIRDVAVWVPLETETEFVRKIITTAAGELLWNEPILFDEFKKDKRKSLAFRLVLQSYEKTLSDEEANRVIESVSGALAAEGFSVR